MKNLSYRDRVLFFYKKHREDNIRPQQAMCHAKHDAKYGEGSNKLDVFENRWGYEGENLVELPQGWSLKFDIQYDDSCRTPWGDCDGMGVIKECRDHPGEAYSDWILNSEYRCYIYYDWKATLKEAIRDRWDAKPYRVCTKREQAMRAMRSTYDYLRRWCENDWYYVGCIVTLYDENEDEVGEESCWGFESCCMDDICSEARSWAARLIHNERKLRRSVKEARHVREAMSEGARV